MSATHMMLDAVKTCLKSQGVTYAELAKRLKMSEAGIKRIFSREALTLQKLEEICEALDVDLFEIAAIAQRRERPLISELSLEQEEALASDRELLMIFYLVNNGWTKKDIITRRRLGERRVAKALQMLDRLGLIEMHASDRIRLLTIPNIRWRPGGPIHAKYDQKSMSEFLFARFDSADAGFHFLFYQFSKRSMTQLKNKLARLNAEALAMAEGDALLPPDEKEDIGLMLAMRPWLFSALDG